jgi:D-galactarolactone cycloisomerase
MATPRLPVITRVRAHLFRAPVARPVINSFGAMTTRPMALVRVEDSDGIVGWGEIWCNFPVVGAEHRARLLAGVFAPLLVGVAVTDPAEAFVRLEAQLATQVLQTGETGPFAQCLAAVDQALTDLAARRQGLPLWRYLGGFSNEARVYASGLGPEGAEPIAQEHWGRGFRTFKLKVGFGRERDLSNLRGLRKSLPESAVVMVDANQAWSTAEATAMVQALREFRLAWIEEPIAADAPLPVWQALARAAAPIPLAAGENLCGRSVFDAAVASSALGVLQPDVGKWGGLSQNVLLARRAVQAGLRFCPHWLGGGVGLMASLHLCAAAGGDGCAEWDANPNPLRERFLLPPVVDGVVTLSHLPGLGFVPDLDALEEYAVTV